jgi:hypothetical protein
MMAVFNTPILFLIYRNPDLTKKTFKKIKELRPPILYIAADGPTDNEKIKSECIKTREITEDIDWDCKVYRRYLDKNKGCKIAVSSAISWFFQKEECGIILEYDCLPNRSFFTFCENMLEKYSDNSKVMHIGGSNGQDGIIRGDGSYYFSAITGIWGWATWRRAWSYYDNNAEGFERFALEKNINRIFTKRYTRKYWLKRFNDVYLGVNNSSWGIPWAFSVMNEDGYCITPNVNLISNIGFGDMATHAFDINSPFYKVALEDIINIKHPSVFSIDNDADNYATKKSYKIEDSFFVILRKNIIIIAHLFIPKKVIIYIKLLFMGKK